MKRINLVLLLTSLLGGAVFVVGVVALHRWQVGRNVGSYAEQGRRLRDEGKVDKALEKFTAYVAQWPEDEDAQRDYARLLLQKARDRPMKDEKAIKAVYDKVADAINVVSKNQEDAGLRLELAEFLVNYGRFNDARSHLSIVQNAQAGLAGSDPAAGSPDIDPVKVQLLLALAHAGEGDFDTAARIAGDMVGYDVQQRVFDPDHQAVEATEPYVLLARILATRLDDPAAANQVFEQLVQRRPDDAAAWLEFARWNYERDDIQLASENLKRARANDPDSPSIVWSMYELAIKQKNLAEADAVLKRARELFPGDERVYLGQAALAEASNDMPGAEAALRDGLGELSDKRKLLLTLADLLLKQGKVDETEEVLAQFKELHGTNAFWDVLDARVLMARNRWTEARRRLEEIRPAAAGYEDLIRRIDFHLQQCYASLGEFDKQLDTSGRMLVDDPTSLAARISRASALVAAGRSDDAITEFETVAESIPAEQLPAVTQVWYPLLQLRVMKQLECPVGERDWTRVDGLIRQLEESGIVSESQLALLRADVLARKGENEAAAEILDRATRAPDAPPEVWGAFVLLTLRERGIEAANELLARVPAEQRDHSALASVRMQLAARAPPEQAAGELAAIEAAADRAAPDEGVQLLSSLAGLRLELGDAAEAERLWRKVVERRPDDLRSQTALLELALRSGDVAKAKAAAAAIEAVVGEKNARALVAQAGVRILQVRLTQEPKELETGKVDLTPAEERLLDEARNLLIEAANDRPGWQLIQTSFAEIDGLKGDIPAAIDHLQKAVRLGSPNPAVLKQLVALLYASNRFEEARQALDMLGPDGLAGFERLSAEMELRSGRLDEAVSIAERAVSLDSRNGAELVWLGQLLERSGKREQAGECFTRAVEVSPDRTDAWMALFSHQLTTGRPKAAENTLARAVAALESPARELVRAQGAEMLGRLDDAERAFQDAVAVTPDDIGIATARSEFLVRAGRLDAARETLRQIIASKDDGAAARSMRAWARRKLAELIASRCTYPQFREALALIDDNAGNDGRLAAEDAVAKVALLANRPEPESWRLAIEVLVDLRERQSLTTAQRLTLAGLLDKVGRWEEARQELMAIVASPKTPPVFIAMLADKLIDHGEIANARPWVKRLEDVAPDAPVTLALEAHLAIADKDRVRADELARRLMPPDDVPADQTGQLPGIAKLLEDLGFPAMADTVFRTYAERSPDGVFARAQFLGRQGRTAEALDALEAAWAALPLEKTLSTAIEILRSNPQDAAAAERIGRWIAKARRVDPESVMISVVDAELRGLQGKPAEVESLYRAILADKNLDALPAAIVSNNLALHLAVPETATEAKQLIDAAIGTIGPHPDLLDTRGLVWLALGSHDRAVTDFEQCVLQPSDVKFLHLAYAQLHAGDKSAARAALEQGKRKGLSPARLSVADRERLREIENALGIAPEQVGSEAAGPGRG